MWILVLSLPPPLPTPPPFWTNTYLKFQSLTQRIQKRTSSWIPLESQFCYLHSNYARIIFLPSFSLKNDKKVTMKKGNYDRVVLLTCPNVRPKLVGNLKYDINIYVDKNVLAHLNWKLNWPFLITFCLASFCLPVRLLTFDFYRKNFMAN